MKVDIVKHSELEPGNALFYILKVNSRSKLGELGIFNNKITFSATGPGPFDIESLEIILQRMKELQQDPEPIIKTIIDQMLFGGYWWATLTGIEVCPCRVVKGAGKIIRGRIPYGDKVLQWMGGDAVSSLEECLQEGYSFSPLLLPDPNKIDYLEYKI